MKSMSKKNILLILIAVGIILITGLTLSHALHGGPEVKVGYMGSNVGNMLKASFRYYDGIESKKVKLSSGDNVKITYTIVATKGNIQVLVKDQSGNEVMNQSDSSGEMSFAVNETQNYNIYVIATKAQGKYEVTWNK
jgi:TusA-related sulfurtransferase